MHRNYADWHALKSRVEHDHVGPLFHEQEIWWCLLGANIGDEEDGKHELFERPVLVWKKFNKNLFWGFPMTSKEKVGRFYYSFPMHGISRTVLLSQMRILSSKRLFRKLDKASDRQYKKISAAFAALIHQSDPFRNPPVPNGNL